MRADDGAVVGVLALSLNVLQLQQVFDSLALPDGSALTLLDQKGQILARSPGGERYIGQTIAAAAEPRAREDDARCRSTSMVSSGSSAPRPSIGDRGR